MAERIQKQKQRQEQESQVEEAVETPSVDASDTLQVTDDILDEIDAVLEQDAEEFVKAYIQKGGQ